MRVVEDVDILSDEGRQAAVARLSLAILAAGVAAFVILVAAGAKGPRAWWATALAIVIGYLACLPVHELAHAAFFKLLGPRGTRVTFGYSAGMLYAGCPGTRFTRGRFRAILLAPLVVLSLAFLVLGAALRDPLAGWALFSLHASGCAGDLYFVWRIARRPEATLCEDTDRGMRLLREDA